MSKNDSKKVLTAEDYIARGAFQVSKMKPGVLAIIESTVGTLYTLRLKDPFTNLVEFYSTEELFRNRPPVPCYFVASWSDRNGTIAIPDQIVKECRMLLRFSDGQYLAHPVRSVLLEGPSWKYEVITP